MVVLIPYNQIIRRARTVLTLTFIILALSVTHIEAVIIDLGNISQDTVSGLEWMDLTESTSISFNDVVAGFTDADSMFFGWRHATINEVTTFWSNAGITHYSAPPDTRNIEFMQLIGITQHAPEYNVDRTRGIIGIMSEHRLYAPQLEHFYNDHTHTVDYGNAYTGDDSAGEHTRSTLGHYLARQIDQQPIPEPGTMFLFGSGVLALARLRRNLNR